MNKNTKSNDIVTKGKLIPSLKEFFQMTVTFILVVIGWIIFRAQSMDQLTEIAYSILSNPFYDGALLYGKTFALNAILLLVIEWLQKEKQHALQFPDNCLFRIRTVRWLTYIAIYLYIIFSMGQSQTFLYFQF